MNLLRSLTGTSGLAPLYTSTDIARLAHVTRGRITQLRSPSTPVPLPAPDGEGSTTARPLWNGTTVARWCAASGRRLPARMDTAMWLMPGPDGPRLERVEQRTLALRQNLDPTAPMDRRRPPVDVHITRYATAGQHGGGPSVWLATVMAPQESTALLGHPPHWPHGSPLQHLVHELLADSEPYRWDKDTPVGTLVLLPTGTDPLFSIGPGLVRLLDLYPDDLPSQASADDRFHHRLRQRPLSAAEMKDLATALGHRLPWWPPGCTTPSLVTAWKPDAELSEPIPPPITAAEAFRRRCEATAADLDGDLADSLRALGDLHWGSASDPWRPGYAPDLGALPTECDPSVWEVAVRFTLAPERHTRTGEIWQGLKWLMDNPDTRHLARDTRKIFGDPDSARTVLLDTATLPDSSAAFLTAAISPSSGHTSDRAERVLEALGSHPAGAAGVHLGTWPALTGPAWCATAPGTSLVAVHVPRSATAPGTEAGQFLDAIVTRTLPESDSYGPGPGVVLVTTDRDRVVILPDCGEAARLAAVIEYTVWHPGSTVNVVGLVPSLNENLIEAVESLLNTTPRTTPWNQLERLAGPHPQREACYYCPS
ncbi:hypothetical protein [Streptomyces sp. NPDC059783]|uniref:hypothetical protein n=1 Tax=Streptomyces sp. NPDC059783 TaxID=3346944 RepID=UPI003651CB27